MKVFQDTHTGRQCRTERTDMIFADKLTQLRKKAGMSQEELAEKVGVSRQAISKWEGAQAMPDMNKVLKLSEVFGVSTDYLLKDDIEEETLSEDGAKESLTDDGTSLTPVSLEEANRYLAHEEANAQIHGLGVFLCIISPSLLLFFLDGDPTNLQIAAGLVVLIAVAAFAVFLFVRQGLRKEPFSYLEKEPLDTAYGVESMVREKKKKHQSIRVRRISIGVALCIVAVIPLIIFSATSSGTDYARGIFNVPSWTLVLLLFLVGFAVFLFVREGILSGACNVLLEEGDYTRRKKYVGQRIGTPFWCAATVLFLVLSFLTGAWHLTWIVWVAAAALWEVLCTLLPGPKA